ncbi:6024_t:CDS:2 [Acaulospora morrowiae]|uniref:6024_t:CDS:1 n=1 Tax=Acaulospora morrowiae TaxID=94023 RepID=A0A9N8YUL4_9GLOM|nr:6024_t:CDS:2 [Acaulospora morrowiae]
MPRYSSYRPNQIHRSITPIRSGHRRSRSPRRSYRRTPSPSRRPRNRSPSETTRNHSPTLLARKSRHRSPSPITRSFHRRSPSPPKRITRSHLPPSTERVTRRRTPSPRRNRRSRSPMRLVSRSPRNRRISPDPYRTRHSLQRTRNSTSNNDLKLIDSKHNSGTASSERIDSTKMNPLAPNKMPSHTQTPSTVKSQEYEVSGDIPSDNLSTTNYMNLNVVNAGAEEVRPRLPSQSPPPKPVRDLIPPSEPRSNTIVNARNDIIDFIIKCCLRLQLPMTTIALALRTYHNYHNYLSQGKNRWLTGYTDHLHFDEELTGIACILLVTKNTDIFKGIRKTLSAGWSLKYPKTPLEDGEKMKETVKIVVSNIKSAIKRERELPKETPYNSASRIFKILIEKLERNINFDYTLSDVFATAAIYITACKIGIDLQAQFSEFCKEFGGCDPLAVKDAITDIIEFKIVDPFEPSIDSNV